MALIHRDCLFEISWQSYTNWWDVIQPNFFGPHEDFAWSFV